jgi:hypothetical protein
MQPYLEVLRENAKVVAVLQCPGNEIQSAASADETADLRKLWRMDCLGRKPNDTANTQLVESQDVQ